MAQDQHQTIRSCSEILANESEPLAKRFRALFTLRNIIEKDSIDSIGKVLLDDDSALLKHECAYCLGQMKDQRAIDYLMESIKDESQHPMVRHEAGEALGAIGKDSKEIMEILHKYAKHDVQELAETCQLALDRMEYYKDDSKAGHDKESLSIYNTIDPTPAYTDTTDLAKLHSVYLDSAERLFFRYMALFALRNIGSSEAIAIICKGLFNGKHDSNLFKHEVAFVLGQIQSLESVDALTNCLADRLENEIVRHECAEALGSMGKSEIISKYLNDDSRIVKESCQVALDMADYYNDDEQFEFLDKKSEVEAL